MDKHKRKKDPSILAFDTSSSTFTAALYAKGRVYTEDIFSERASEALFGSIDRLMKRAKWECNRIDLIAVGMGPGSFTGLRVGVVVAKTLAYALNVKIVGISTLKTIAQNVAGDGVCRVLMKAGRGNVYAASYQKFREIERPRLIRENDRSIKKLKGFAVIGDAILPASNQNDFRVRARRMVVLAKQRWQNQSFDDPMTIKPAYLYKRTCNVRK